MNVYRTKHSDVSIKISTVRFENNLFSYRSRSHMDFVVFLLHKYYTAIYQRSASRMMPACLQYLNSSPSAKVNTQLCMEEAAAEAK